MENIVGTANGFSITLCPPSSFMSELKCSEQIRLPPVGTKLTSAFLSTFSSHLVYISGLVLGGGGGGGLQPQPRTQALSSTLLAGENTLAGAGHVYPKFWVAKSIIAVGGVVEESVCRVWKIAKFAKSP